MPRGAQGKLRRRNNRSNKTEKNDDIFDLDDNGQTPENAFSEELPLPPGMARTDAPVEADDSDDAGETSAASTSMPKKGKKKKLAGNAMPPTRTAPKQQGIKTLPLIFLILMTGTTLIPAFIYAGDFASAFFAKNDVLGNIGFRLGIGQVPKKRVLSFYEKHAPEKVSEVPNILSKYYGDYPALIKKLERKYQDYGYFLGWEEDEGAKRLISDYFTELYKIYITQWNKLAPQVLKTAARNGKYNLTKLYKKLSKIWRKTLWPLIEPIFGVPDGAEKQKRQDAAEARKRRETSRRSSGSTTTRRKNRDFRDDEED